MKPIVRIRNIIMVLIGVLGLLAKRWLSGTISELAYCYLGNFTVSFAVYFLITFAVENRMNRFMCIIISLAIVEVFEFTDGFGIMTNVYDVYDYLANALGIALAYLVDVFSTPMILAARSKKK